MPTSAPLHSTTAPSEPLALIQIPLSHVAAIRATAGLVSSATISTSVPCAPTIATIWLHALILLVHSCVSATSAMEAPAFRAPTKMNALVSATTARRVRHVITPSPRLHAAAILDFRGTAWAATTSTSVFCHCIIVLCPMHPARTPLAPLTASVCRDLPETAYLVSKSTSVPPQATTVLLQRDAQMYMRPSRAHVL